MVVRHVALTPEANREARPDQCAVLDQRQQRGEGARGQAERKAGAGEHETPIHHQDDRHR